MKIVLIHGQNHKGSTYNISKLLLEELKENDIKEFFLPKDLNHFCAGCYKCIDNEEECPFYNEKKVIMEEVEKADLLIFTTPAYCMRASAPMKSFIDLTFTYWMSHRPRACMFNKKAIIISTSAGVGAKTATKDIKTALFYWGVPYIKSYGIAVQAMNWEMVSAKKKKRIKKDMNKMAKKIVKMKKVKVGIKTKFFFGIMRMMQNNNMGSSPIEKEYWNKNGWLGKVRPWK